MTTRKEIRDAARAAITSYDNSLTTYTGRAVSIPSDRLPAVSVYFEEGTVAYTDLDSSSMVSATLKIDITDSDPGNDDSIDELADALINSVLSSIQFSNLLFSSSWEGFSYERDGKQPFTTFSAMLSVTFEQ
jgi:Phage minor tail protein U